MGVIGTRRNVYKWYLWVKVAESGKQGSPDVGMDRLGELRRARNSWKIRLFCVWACADHLCFVPDISNSVLVWVYISTFGSSPCYGVLITQFITGHFFCMDSTHFISPHHATSRHLPLGGDKFSGLLASKRPHLPVVDQSRGSGYRCEASAWNTGQAIFYHVCYFYKDSSWVKVKTKRQVV